ncbi:MAG: zinc ribbon domain-containing protein [Lachnospiraceae bacterium]|nr:zinc ribbon domain-containing protein [Lachnospiraceae bacterium]
MICRECGRNTENENANFCFYCGARLSNERFENVNIVDRMQSVDYEYTKINEEKNVAANNELPKSQPFSVLKYVGLMMLPFLFPPFSSIAFVVILFMYAFRKDDPYVRNWAIAMLIVAALFIILAISMFDYIGIDGMLSTIQNG